MESTSQNSQSHYLSPSVWTGGDLSWPMLLRTSVASAAVAGVGMVGAHIGLQSSLSNTWDPLFNSPVTSTPWAEVGATHVSLSFEAVRGFLNAIKQVRPVTIEAIHDRLQAAFPLATISYENYRDPETDALGLRFVVDTGIADVADLYSREAAVFRDFEQIPEIREAERHIIIRIV